MGSDMRSVFKAVMAFILSAAVVIVVFAVMIGVFLAPKDSVLESLPRYETKEYFSSGGFQDYTDYAKYTYRVSESELAENEYLRPVTQGDIPTILAYVEDFEGWVEISQDFPKESYDFDKSTIGEGDYWFLQNRYEDPEKAFWNYDLYYFDVDASSLYYFHSNM